MCGDSSLLGNEGGRRERLPWYALPRGLLHLHKVREDAEFGRGGGDHHDEPEVELCFGPVVFAAAFDDAHDFGGHFGGGGRGRRACP